MVFAPRTKDVPSGGRHASAPRRKARLLSLVSDSVEPGVPEFVEQDGGLAGRAQPC